MDNMLLYMLKVTAGTTLFYLTYLAFFRKDTFYVRNRTFLILTLILPVLFPLLKIQVTVNNSVPSEPVNEIISQFPTDTFSRIVQSASTTATSFDIFELTGWIYLIGVALLIIRGLISLTSTLIIIRRGVIRSNKFPKIVISDIKHPPFSFYPYAVIPSAEYNCGNCSDILDHEFAHLRQGHTFDLLLSEAFITFQWFNPFAWLIKRSMVLNHEYLADQVSVSNRSIKEYQYRLLIIAGELKAVSLTHTFNSLIKNRIIMINKKPTHKNFAWKNIIILPAILAAVYAFATPEYNYTNPENEVLIIQQTPSITQKSGRGVVTGENGNSLEKYGIQASEDSVYMRADEFPEFPGGFPAMREFYTNNIKYPEDCLENAIEGSVAIRIIIEKNGSVTFQSVLKSAHPLLDNELIRVIKICPKFKPAKINSNPVRFSMVIPYEFKL